MAENEASDPLVLQPGFMLAGSLEPVGSACALLMASAPDGPAQDGGVSGWMLPDEMPEKTPHLGHGEGQQDRKSTRLNSSHANISYAVFCLKTKKEYRR